MSRPTNPFQRDQRAFIDRDVIAPAPMNHEAVVARFKDTLQTPELAQGTLVDYLHDRGLSEAEIPDFKFNRKKDFWEQFMDLSAPNREELDRGMKDFQSAVLYNTATIKARAAALSHLGERQQQQEQEQQQKPQSLSDAASASSSQAGLPGGANFVPLDALVERFRGANTGQPWRHKLERDWEKKYRTKYPTRTLGPNGEEGYLLDVSPAQQEKFKASPHARSGYLVAARTRMLGNEVAFQLDELKKRDAQLLRASQAFGNCIKGLVPQPALAAFQTCMNTYAAAISSSHLAAQDVMSAISKSQTHAAIQQAVSAVVAQQE
jgi:hypothetical protein